jgi:hypothetical protein
VTIGARTHQGTELHRGPGRPTSGQQHGLLRWPGRWVLVVPVRLRVGTVQVGSVPPRTRGRHVHVALRRLAPPAVVVERARPHAIGRRPHADPRALPTPSARQAQAHDTSRAVARAPIPAGPDRGPLHGSTTARLPSPNRTTTSSFARSSTVAGSE